MSTTSPNARSLALHPRSYTPPAPRWPKRRTGGFSGRLHEALYPSGIDPPRVAPDFFDMSRIAKTAECWRYFVAEIEYFLSPGGSLRAWFALWLLLTFYLAVPCLLFLPVVQWALASVDTGSWHVFNTVKHVSLTVQEVLKAALLTTLGFVALKALLLLAKIGIVGMVLLLAAFATGWWHGWWNF